MRALLMAAALGARVVVGLLVAGRLAELAAACGALPQLAALCACARRLLAVGGLARLFLVALVVPALLGTAVADAAPPAPKPGATLATAASPLTPSDLPPGRLGCPGDWQTARRLAGFDAGVPYVLEALYAPAQAGGRLLRRGASIDAGTPAVGSALWEAGAVLDSGVPPPAARRIYTMSASGTALAFDWPRLDAAQRAALDPAGDGLGEARLAFLRGAREREGDPFRRRAGLLGDIVRSIPLLVGAPASGADAGQPGYAAFFERYRQRQKLVYVGANDGMLHAFDWNEGSERFAYIPGLLLPDLYQLSSASYRQRAWVDGAPGQGEALIGGNWRSVLASGLGMGARGLFALDISDPAADPAVLWEFGERDDPAVGFIEAPPLVLKLRSKAGKTGGGASYRYFVLFAGGFDPADGGNDGIIFLLALDKPAGVPWRRGENYYRLRAAARDGASASGGANALAAPVLTLNADGSAHSAYAGDLQGTMWRFDLEDLASAGGDELPAAVLYRARSADGVAQPIAEPARVVFGPGGGYLVLFGTGSSHDNADFDPAHYVQQSFYAVHDSDLRPIATIAGRSALVERTLRPAPGSAGGFVIEGDSFDYTGSGARHGWYVDFPRSLQEGERNAAAPTLAGTALVIASLAPGADRCSPAVRSYVVDTLSGLAHDARGGAVAGVVSGLRASSTDGSLPTVLAPTDLLYAASPATPTGAVRAMRQVGIYLLPSTGAAQKIDQVVVSAPAGRLSWREIVNWRELHDAATTPSRP